jgi:hypothetical protein
MVGYPKFKCLRLPVRSPPRVIWNQAKGQSGIIFGKSLD